MPQPLKVSIMKIAATIALLCGVSIVSIAVAQEDGSVLPFPVSPSTSTAGQTLQQSVHKE
jgi:hypothetical protein